MKIRLEYLFLTTTLILILAGSLTAEKRFDLNVHSAYIIIPYKFLAYNFGFLTGFITIIYVVLKKLRHPIRSKTGLWHFGLFIIGILLVVSIISQPTNKYSQIGNLSESYSYEMTPTLAIGVLLILISIAVFIYGLIVSFLRIVLKQTSK